MLRILSWNSNTGFKKMPSEDVPHLSQKPSSHLTSCTVSSIKRKRPDTAADFPTDCDAVRNLVNDGLKAISQASAQAPSQVPCPAEKPSQTQDLLSEQSFMPVGNTKMEIDTAPSFDRKIALREEAQLATMRQTISSQLSLEILVKHRELRLIDQEIAKCQIALEQLRRCTEIPYPALRTPSTDVSCGQGPAVNKSTSQTNARSPAPWGVTDGPYTRHYAKWLLADPHFDGGVAECFTPVSVPHHGRNTRGVHTDFAQMVGKTSRSQRAMLFGLPPGYAEPKQKPTGPMVLKRKSDGKMVKLVCPDCGRLDFGSAQGFINHCRIGHQRNYKSHDDAAEGCGQPLEEGETVSVRETQPHTAPVSIVTTPVSAIPSKPIVTPTANAGLHPLVQTAHLVSKEALVKPLVKGVHKSKSERKVKKAKKPSASLRKSDTPYLSELLQDRGLNLDLTAAVAEAKKRDDLQPEWDYYTDFDQDSPLPTPSTNSRLPLPAGKKPSGKSLEGRSGARKPSFNHNRGFGSIDTASSGMQTPAEEHPFHHFMPLMPSPTNDSTQAPSLIDDDEEMDPQSPPSSDEHEQMDVHFHVRDDDHPEEHHELRGQELPPAIPPCSQPATNEARPVARPLSSMGGSNFVPSGTANEEQGDMKRRRIGQ